MEEQLRRIQQKTAQLMEQHQKVLLELALLKKEKETLEQSLYEKNALLLEKQATNVGTRLEKEALEEKLNHYIKEIDQCIQTMQKT